MKKENVNIKKDTERLKAISKSTENKVKTEKKKSLICADGLSFYETSMRISQYFSHFGICPPCTSLEHP